MLKNFKNRLNPRKKLNTSTTPVSPISRGAGRILLPYIVALKENFQKSYSSDIRLENQLFRVVQLEKLLLVLTGG